MVPLYAARIEDQGSSDFVRVQCLACGHDEQIPASALVRGLRLPPATGVLDVEPWLRSRSAIREAD